ncbi:MAG: FumA C-terminus/TtdB family hydratase beta subunit [Actinomycetes bacterium]|jgi:tartrate/fumarate subfamily iron-sulfur-dependent hydro-lyase beta chain|nr:FumA C-terminus/TtdB family hydratase beta subunit [Actinomycetes bacterium]
MSEPRRISLPFTADVVRDLRAGDELLLSGPAYTARDAAFARLVEQRPADVLQQLRGQLVFFAGPTPPRADRPAGAIGPTTASRMDALQVQLMDDGVLYTLGKGSRGQQYVDAARAHGAVYLAAVGGAAALLARAVNASRIVAWPDLGTEAVARLNLVDFPAFVAIDASGNDIYRTAPQQWRVQRQGTQQ